MRVTVGDEISPGQCSGRISVGGWRPVYCRYTAILGDSIMFYLATSISLFVHPFLPPAIVWARGFTPSHLTYCAYIRLLDNIDLEKQHTM